MHSLEVLHNNRVYDPAVDLPLLPPLPVEAEEVADMEVEQQFQYTQSTMCTNPRCDNRNEWQLETSDSLNILFEVEDMEDPLEDDRDDLVVIDEESAAEESSSEEMEVDEPEETSDIDPNPPMVSERVRNGERESSEHVRSEQRRSERER